MIPRAYVFISVLTPIKGSVIVELAEYLGTTAGYLLNGEVGEAFGEEEKKMLEFMAMLKNSELKRVAVQQIRILTQII